MYENIIISGATGFIGRRLTAHLTANNYQVIALSRHPEKYQNQFNEKVRFIQWNGKELDPWPSGLTEVKAVINLAGENIGAGLWTRKRKQRLLASRLNTTRGLVAALQQSPVKPVLFIQMSAIGYYGIQGDVLLDESSPLGSGFLADLTDQWEEAASGVSKFGTKLVKLRTGLVLGKGGGLLARLTPAFRFFLGGHFGKGDQWMSWIHLEDVVRIIHFILMKKPAAAVYNLTSPQPVLARDFFQTVGRMLHRPSWLHSPEWPLKLVLGEMARETILSSQKVSPAQLLRIGYEFQYSQLTAALQEVFGEGD